MEWSKVTNHIYIINLPRRTDRKKLMEYKLNKIGIIDYEFFDATDGYDKKYDEIYDKIKKQFNSRGALGLILTYIRLLKDAYVKKYTSIMILEDDINAHIHINKQSLVSVFADVLTKKDYDIIWLGANQPKISETQINDVKSKNMYLPEPKKNNYTYGTYSMILTYDCIAKLIRTINDVNISKLKPIDNLLNDLIIDNKISGIVLYPYLFIPDVSESDNMPARDQNKFSLTRGFNMKDYEYISQIDVNLLKEFIESSLSKKYNESIMNILKNMNNTNNVDVPENIKQAFLRITDVVSNYDDIVKFVS